MSSTPLAFSVSTTSARSSRLISGSSCAARSRCSRSVQSRSAKPRRGAPRAARPLIGGGPADFFHEQRIDAAIRIEPRDARQPAIDHHAHAVDGQRGLRDVRGDDDLPLPVVRQRRILIGHGQLPMQRQHHEFRAHARTPHRLDRAVDLVRARHENEHVSLGHAGQPLQFIGGDIPDRDILGAVRLAAGTRSPPERRGPRSAAWRRAPGNWSSCAVSSVADMTISFRSGRAACWRSSARASVISPYKCRSWNSSKMIAATPVSFGSCRSCRSSTPSVTKRIFVFGGDHAVEADLVADFLPELRPALLRHARRQHARGQPAGLQHDHLALAQQPVIQQHLRHLRRFAGAGGRLQDQAGSARAAPPRGRARVRRWEGPADSSESYETKIRIKITSKIKAGTQNS